MNKKLPIVRQQDVKDCGPCALQSIIKYYGGYVPLEKIRADAFTSIKGTTVYHLMEASKKYGFDVQAKKIKLEDINNIMLPAIVHILYENGQTHYMCLYKVNKSNLVFMDPDKGKRILSYDEFAKIFTGVVIEFAYQGQILCLEKETSVYKLFGQIMLKNKSLCINLIICSFLLMVSTIVLSLYFKVFYEFLQKGEAKKFIVYFFIIILLLKLASTYVKSYYENYLNKNIDVELFSSFLKHIFHLPLKVINTRSSGEIISRINDIFSIKELFCEIFVSIFLDVILAMGSLICLFNINVHLALILLLFISIYLIMAYLSKSYISKRINQNIDCQTKINTSLMENINMINSIKNLNKTDTILQNLEENASDFIYDNFTFANILNKLNMVKNAFLEIGIFITNTYGLYLCYLQKIDILSLFIFNSLMVYLLDPVKSIADLFPKFTYLKVTFSKIGDFVDIKEEKLGNLEPFTNGDITFKNISFSYDNYHQILKNFNLTIKCGEKVIIKGKSGTGKSTLCALMQKIYEPNLGTIEIGGKNILDYNNFTLRKNITYVSQNENLYSDTIKNNIIFQNTNPSFFDDVCKICQIEDIVATKSFRYNFGIDNSIQNISGGEKQRIILARALMDGGDILILDEALSQLDYHLERKIINNMINAFPNKTIIYISHKNQDNLFDRVINLESVSN